MTLVFNELSASAPARTRADAAARMTEMVRAIAALADDRAPKLVTVGSFDLHGAVLADGYSLREWLHDDAADRDLRTFLLRITAKVGFDSDVSKAVKDQFLLSEFRLDDREAGGLGLSYLLGTAAVSLRSEPYWMRVHVPLRYMWLAEDGTLQHRGVDALNIAHHSHALDVNHALVAQAQKAVAGSPTALAERKHECFPHLQFGLDVDSQLATLAAEVVEQVIAKLIVLDSAVRDWRRDGAVPPLPMIRSESKPTMQKYGTRRVFRSADGAAVVFERHAMVGSGYRIHLRVDQRAGVLEIGYIGVHLPTVRFPH